MPRPNILLDLEGEEYEPIDDESFVSLTDYLNKSKVISIDEHANRICSNPL